MMKTQLGVVIVTFNAGGEAVDCVETLLGSARAAGLRPCVVVVDNGSRDDTVARLCAWADGSVPYVPPEDMPFAPAALPKPVALERGGPDAVPAPDTEVLVIESGANLGFAGGVNLGLASLAARPGIGDFWVLNPDSVVPPEAMTALADRLADPAPYGLMGGRVTYLDQPGRIQLDGGSVNRRTGVTGNVNLGRPLATTPPPAPEDLDFIVGASMIASRAFYERVGPMHEDYFLYYEEVDWAMRRGDLPLAVCPGLRIYHRAGSAIGSPRFGRGASPFSVYFKHRGRIMFLRRFHPRSLPVGHAYTIARALKYARQRDWPAARALLAGGLGLAPPAEVAARLGPETMARLGSPSARGPR